MKSVSLKLEQNFLLAINKVMKKNNYMTKAEFIREALRDKIRVLEEKEIFNDRELMAQIKASEKILRKVRLKSLSISKSCVFQQIG